MPRMPRDFRGPSTRGFIVQIVAGLSLKNLQPRVWDPSSEFYLSGLSAVMVSYAEFHRMKARRAACHARWGSASISAFREKSKSIWITAALLCLAGWRCVAGGIRGVRGER